jgi:hypothetical protein
MGWLKDPEAFKRWWRQVTTARVYWWHYLILFIAYVVGYFTAVFFNL